MNEKHSSIPSPADHLDSDIDAARAQFAAARARVNQGLNEFSDDTRAAAWQMALPFACGALVGSVAFWLLRSRKPRTFALVQFVTQPPPKPAATPGLLSAAWGAGARVVLPQLLELLSQRHPPEDDNSDTPPVAH